MTRLGTYRDVDGRRQIESNEETESDRRPHPPAVEVVDIAMAYAGGLPVIDGLSFAVGQGELVCIVGPSGCGKTTLLRLLAGLAAPIRGRVVINGRPVSGPSPGVAIVFQDYGRALCPWRTAIRNVELPLEAAGLSRTRRRSKARSALESVGLGGCEKKYPRHMSGGMQQRLQIARSLVQEPEIMLMDEPFASVDALTRYRLEDTTLELWRTNRQTLILVTHDLDEAIYLADRVLVLSTGPAAVIADVAVPLSRPRDQAATRAAPAFVELRHALFERIRELEPSEEP